jgi:U3 small nucleolar RNA-associated protein 10
MTAFWRDDKLRSLASPLISQIPICVSQSETAKAVLTATLSNFGSIVNDENLLKSVNLEILMQTRSEDPRQRILALDCAQQLWTSNGSKLLGKCLFCPLRLHAP